MSHILLGDQIQQKPRMPATQEKAALARDLRVALKYSAEPELSRLTIGGEVRKGRYRRSAEAGTLQVQADLGRAGCCRSLDLK